MRRKKPRTCGSSVSCKRRRKTASVPVTSPSGGKDCRFPAMRPTPEEPLALSGVATGYEAASMVFLLRSRAQPLCKPRAWLSIVFPDGRSGGLASRRALCDRFHARVDRTTIVLGADFVAIRPFGDPFVIEQEIGLRQKSFEERGDPAFERRPSCVRGAARAPAVEPSATSLQPSDEFDHIEIGNLLAGDLAHERVIDIDVYNATRQRLGHWLTPYGAPLP